MRKRLLHLFSALCLAGLAANAEVIQNYEYNFDDEINTSDKYFHPAGWIHSVTGSYGTAGSSSSFGSYTWISDGGRDGSGCIEGKQAASYYYDILYTPAVTGTASVYVKQKESTGSILIYSIGKKNSENAYSFTQMEVDIPALSTEEWVKVEIPAQENARIGLRLDKVYIDDFSAAEVNLELAKSFVVSNPRVADKNAYSDENGVYHITYDIDVTNTGDAALIAGETGYALNHCYDPSGGYAFSYDDYTFVGSTNLPESLEVGETKTMNIKAAITRPDSYSRKQISVIDDMSKDYKKEVKLAEFTFIPYEPKAGLFITGTEEEYWIAGWNSNTATLTMGVVTEESQKKKTVTIKNTAPLAPVTIEDITLDGTDFSVDFTGSKTLAPGESLDVVISLVNEHPGVFVNKMTITAKGIDDINANVTAAVPAEGVAQIGFEDSSIPVGFIATGDWKFTQMPDEYATDGHKTAITSDSEESCLTTSKMSVEAEEILMLSGYAEDRYYNVKVEYSNDRSNWNIAYNSDDVDYAYRPSEDTGVEGKYQRSFIAVENIPAGEWYVKVSAKGFNIDDIYGFIILPVEPELVIASSNIPATAMVNNPFVVSVDVSNAGDTLEASDYTVTLFVDDEEFCVAKSEDMAPGATLSFEMSGILHEAGEYETYIEVKLGDKVTTTDSIKVTVREESAEGSQYVIGPDTGTSNGPIGASSYRGYIVRETTYSKDRIASYAEGLTPNTKIKALSYFGKYTGEKSIEAEFKVYVQNVTESSLNGRTSFSDVETMQKVYDGNVSISKQDGGVLFTVEFDEPFIYEGDGINILTQSFIPNPPEDYPTLNYWNLYGGSGSAIEYKSSSKLETLPASGSKDSYLMTVGFTTGVDVAVVSGTVTHATSKEPLADVAITLESPENVIYKTVTDENGEYTVNVLQPDKQYKVKASKDKLDDYESEEYLDLSGLSATHHFTMTGVTTGVESIQAGALRVKVVAGGILISAENDADVTVYDLLGRTVLRIESFAGEKMVSLPAGIYVVNNRKVAVK
ncbi:MAG: carboxypeptidase regulatory-like domain-containing protein [Muribaculaceae bacterium]|nr:carboxypeptidase regulatory-like domain-containing protein [Muribaculaceae bacterium]